MRGLRMSLRKTLTWIVASLVATCVIAPQLLADDAYAPSWRGSEGTTFQRWNFDTESNPGSPTSESNAYGSSTATITVDPVMGSGWWSQMDGLGSKTGFWDIGGEGGKIDLAINNTPGASAATDVWIQVTYFQDLTDAPTLDLQPTGATMLSQESQTVEQAPISGTWQVWLTKWHMDPNSGSFGVTLTGSPMGSIIEDVVVDTKVAAVPEPASFVGLLCGGLAMIARRRRFLS
jgi:hypothetical protein